MSKKDKKKEDMNDFDDILGEFGVLSTDASEDNVEGGGEKEKKGKLAEVPSGDGGVKKKKKKKKKSAKPAPADDWVKVEQQPSIESSDDVKESAAKDVAALLKSKSVKSSAKKSTAADIAAKEAKTKAALKAKKNAAKEKKKKKASYVK